MQGLCRTGMFMQGTVQDWTVHAGDCVGRACSCRGLCRTGPFTQGTV